MKNDEANYEVWLGEYREFVSPFFEKKDIKDWETFSRNLKNPPTPAIKRIRCFFDEESRQCKEILNNWPEFNVNKKIIKLLKVKISSKKMDTINSLSESKFTKEELNTRLTGLKFNQKEVDIVLNVIEEYKRDIIINNLNGVIQKSDLYASEAFFGVNLNREGEDLRERFNGNQLKGRNRVRFNRRLLEGAFPGVIEEKFELNKGLLEKWRNGDREAKKEVHRYVYLEMLFRKTCDELLPITKVQDEHLDKTFSTLDRRVVSPLFLIQDITKWKRFLKHLQNILTPERKRLWDLLDKKSKNIINTWKAEKKIKIDDKEVIINGLNKIIQRFDFYTPSSFAQINMVNECKEFINKGLVNLNFDEIQWLNRRLLEASFPEVIKKKFEWSDIVGFLSFLKKVYDSKLKDQQKSDIRGEKPVSLSKGSNEDKPALEKILPDKNIQNQPEKFFVTIEVCKMQKVILEALGEEFYSLWKGLLNAIESELTKPRRKKALIKMIKSISVWADKGKKEIINSLLEDAKFKIDNKILSILKLKLNAESIKEIDNLKDKIYSTKKLIVLLIERNFLNNEVLFTLKHSLRKKSLFGNITPFCPGFNKKGFYNYLKSNGHKNPSTEKCRIQIRLELLNEVISVIIDILTNEIQERLSDNKYKAFREAFLKIAPYYDLSDEFLEKKSEILEENTGFEKKHIKNRLYIIRNLIDWNLEELVYDLPEDELNPEILKNYLKEKLKIELEKD